MSLQDIVKNSNYVTDEAMLSANLLGIANTGIAEVNGYCDTMLPFFIDEQTTKSTYNAIPETWQLRLLEPYYAYAIMANDGDTNARDFHYNRFLTALQQFKEKGLGDILTVDPETGELTGYEGDSVSYRKIDVSDVSVHWKGWF